MSHLRTYKRNSILYFLPRVFAIIFICFLAIFAFDVIVPGKPLWYILGGFIIHLIPNYLLLVALVIAWKKEVSGGIVFLLLGIGFTWFFQTYLFLPAFLIVSFPIFLIGILFLWHNHLARRKNFAKK